MADVGFWALVFTLALSIYAALGSVLGARRGGSPLQESARNGIYAAAAAATMATLALFLLLIVRDYGVRYVYEHVSNQLPLVYTISAFWAGQEGSLLLWLWLVTLLSAWMALKLKAAEPGGGFYALATMACTQAFLALILVVISSPFETLGVTPLEGHGLNPLLRNIGMVVHPPVVFLGYALYTVPFALAVGALFSNEIGPAWVRQVRFWSLMAWLALGMGILLGAWWAYVVLGWGGYWAWDPVENASLIPWLTGTALLHSLMAQERRGAFKMWNVALVSANLLLCILATFVTRSGIIQSVHAFGRSALGHYFLAFILVAGALVGALMVRRRRLLRSPYEISHPLSREASLMLTNLLFVGAALTVLLGTIFPAITEALQGRQAALGASFYARTVVPLAVIIVLLIGFCPWLAWGGVSARRLGRSLALPLAAGVASALLLFALGVRQPFALFSFATTALVAVSILQVFYQQALRPALRAEEGRLAALGHLLSRNRRRYGAHFVHLGIVLMALGITGSSAYQSEVQVALAPNEAITHRGYTLLYRDLVSQSLPDKQRFVALVSVQRQGREIATLRPEKSFYTDVNQWISRVDTRSTLQEDLYISLAGANEEGLATFQVQVNPLVSWIWIGGIWLLLGTLLAGWPGHGREKA